MEDIVDNTFAMTDYLEELVTGVKSRLTRF